MAHHTLCTYVLSEEDAFGGFKDAGLVVLSPERRYIGPMRSAFDSPVAPSANIYARVSVKATSDETISQDNSILHTSLHAAIDPQETQLSLQRYVPMI
jgi:hypothetical protein